MKAGTAVRPKLMRLFAALAAIGFLASVAVHLATFFGWSPGEPIYVLHIGVFVVSIPAFLLADPRAKNQTHEEYKERVATLALSVPNWLKVGVALLFAYMVVNSVLFAIYGSDEGTPRQINGERVLYRDGEVVPDFSPEEFDRAEAYELRGVSGLWMVFYAAAFAILQGALRPTENAVALKPPDNDRGKAKSKKSKSRTTKTRRTASSPLGPDESR